MTSGIFNSPFIETIICLVLIFALLSLLVSTITEAINSYFQERGRVLYRTLGQLFEDYVNPNFGQIMYTHPMIDNLKKDKNSLPQYISAETFGKALTDVISNWARPYAYDGKAIMPEPDDRTAFDRFVDGVKKMEHTPVKLLLLNMVDRCRLADAAASIGALEKELQQWYNDQMDRVSGWYKTWTRTRLFWVALIVTVALNVDSIYLFQYIYKSPGLREKLLPVAEKLADNYAAARADSTIPIREQMYQAVRNTKFPKDSTNPDSALRLMERTISTLGRIDTILHNQDSARARKFKESAEELQDFAALDLPVGWHRAMAPISWGYTVDKTKTDYLHFRQRGTPWNIAIYILGIFITALSLSAGAPFWFDVLLKLVNMRRTGAKPSTSKKQ
jgi:hypothetical protein